MFGFVCSVAWGQAQGGYIHHNTKQNSKKQVTKQSQTKKNKAIPLKKRALTKDDVKILQYTSYTIPESIGEYRINSIAEEAFRNCQLESLTIPNTIDSIGKMAFYYCSRLTNIVLPNNLKVIPESSFRFCGSLKSITIPISVTRIEEQAFRACKSLTSIIIPKNVLYIGNMTFSNCPMIESFIVENNNPNYDSRNGCNAIINSKNNELIAGCKNTIIPNTVTSIGSMAFYGCREIKSITIPRSVKKIYTSAFGDCINLSTIIIDQGNPIYDSRNNCNAIIETSNNKLIRGCKNTTIPTDCDIIIGNEAFDYCGITSITIPSNVKAIGRRAFAGNKKLESVTSLSVSPPELSLKAFDGISENALLYVPQGAKASYENAGWSQYFSKIVEQDNKSASREGMTKVDGYRVQVYAGTNTRMSRLEAERIGSEIKNKFPDHKVYVHFYSPRWICRVGDFKTYESANSFLNRVKGLGYNDAKIVKGKINFIQ